MPWFQVDDQLPVHRKVIAAGNAAMGLWVRAGSWSQGNLTGGFIPRDMARTLGTVGQAKELVAAGLWHVVNTGYVFHDWDKHQMPVEEILDRRRKRAEAGRLGGKASGQSRRGASAEANASPNVQQVVNGKRTPVPVPGPSVVDLSGGVTQVDVGDPPPPCTRHPNGYDHDENCRKCQRLREYDEKRTEHQARENRSREHRDRMQREAAISACRLCDSQGQIDMPDLFTDGNHPTLCPHDAAEVERSRKEILDTKRELADK